MQKNSNPHLVVQSNQFINLRHTLSLAEARVFLSMVAQIERDDDDFKTYRIDVKDFSGMVGLKGQSSYSALREVAESLRYKEFKTLKPDGGWLIMGYISSAEYLPGQGVVELSFDPKLKPYLLNLKEAFTQYDIRYIISLRSIHSVRIYELLKQYERLRTREFDLQELKYKLNIDDKYKRYTDFKNNVLEIAKRDLMKMTDIYFDYEEIKEGRLIKRIRFNIYSKNEGQEEGSVTINVLSDGVAPAALQPVIIVPALHPEIMALFQVFDPQVTPDSVMQFMNGLEEQQEQVLDVLYFAKEEQMRGTQIRNIMAYVRKGLQTSLGKGLYQQAKARKEQVSSAKRKAGISRQIDTWYKQEFPLYLSEYYIQLGKAAAPDTKHRFLRYIENLVSNNIQLKHIYYEKDGKLNQEQMRSALGRSLSEEKGETEDSLFVTWCLLTKKLSVERKGNSWIEKESAPLSDERSGADESEPF